MPELGATDFCDQCGQAAVIVRDRRYILRPEIIFFLSGKCQPIRSKLDHAQKRARSLYQTLAGFRSYGRVVKMAKFSQIFGRMCNGTEQSSDCCSNPTPGQEGLPYDHRPSTPPLHSLKNGDVALSWAMQPNYVCSVRHEARSYGSYAKILKYSLCQPSCVKPGP